MERINHILTSFTLNEKQLAEVKQLLPDVVITQRERGQVTPEDVAAADVIFGNLPTDLLEYAKKVKWIHTAAAGSDATHLRLQKNGVLLTNGSGAYNDSIAEYMLAYTMALSINLPGYFRNQQNGVWKRCGWVKNILGSTVVVLGCGNIGTAYARKMHALGAYVIGVRRRPSECPEGVDEMITMEQVDEVLPRADIVAMVMPSTPETIGLMDARRIGMLKEGAFLINCGRGNAIDQEALYQALANGRLGGAGLDVFQKEPLPADDKLWKLPNLIITPHAAGGWNGGSDASSYMTNAVGNVFLKNLKAYLAGEDMPNEVDPETGYLKRRGGL